MTYDGTEYTATGTATGVLGETLTGLDLSGTVHVNAGSYLNDPWTFTDLTGNYHDASGTMENLIAQRPITVTADDQTKVYGEADPILTYQVTDGLLVTGDSFTGDLAREPGEDVKSYLIHQGTLAADSNYMLTFVEAYLTIISSQSYIETIITDVQEMVATGVLNEGNGNALIVKVQGAIDKLEDGKTAPAVNKLNAFINQINVFIRNGKLTPAEGLPLIEMAEMAIQMARADGGSTLLAESISQIVAPEEAVPIEVAEELVTGVMWVSFQDTTGSTTTEHRLRIEDAITSLNTTFDDYGVALSLLEPGAVEAPHIQIEVLPTSEYGGMAEGILGLASTGSITLISGWNWYVGADTAVIDQGQYDFQTIATHELGHILGLDHSGDATSVMNAYLAEASLHRDITAHDLLLLGQSTASEPSLLRAAPRQDKTTTTSGTVSLTRSALGSVQTQEKLAHGTLHPHWRPCIYRQRFTLGPWRPPESDCSRP